MINSSPVSNLYDADRIAEIAEQLFDLSDQEMSAARKAGTWSRKQILGHLIDSASVNHQRFLQAQIDGSIVFDGYKHEEWVELQDYQHAEWEELVTLWCSLNMHLCTVVERIPADVLDALQEEHSYETMAYRPVPSDQPSSLRYLIDDYFAHLQHHLHQIEDV